MGKFNAVCRQIGQFAAYLFALTIPLSTGISTVAVMLAVLMWGLSGEWQLKKQQLFSHPLSLSVIAFSSYFFLTAFYSVASIEHLFTSLKDFARLLYIPALMYYFYTPHKARLALWLFVSAMILTFLLSVMKVYGGIPIGDQMNYANKAYGVSASVFKSHIQTNFFMAIAAFFLVHQAIEMKNWRLIMGLLAAMLIFYIFYMSWGRTGQILFAGLVFLTILQVLKIWRLRIMAISVLLLSLPIIYLSSDTLQFRINQIKQDIQIYETGGPLETSSLGSRIAFAKNSLQLAKNQFWFGSGLGSFSERYENAFPNAFFTDNPHNEYLLLWVEGGLVGLIALVLLILAQLHFSRQLPDDTKKIAQGIILAFFVGCLANSWLHDSTEGSFFIFMTACLFARLPITRSERDDATQRLHYSHNV